MKIESYDITQLTLDDRDSDDQTLVIPEDLQLCTELNEITVPSFYKKNNDICIDFINSHPIIAQLKKADIFYLDGMNLDRLSNVSSLTLNDTSFTETPFPSMAGLLNLEELIMWFSPSGTDEDLQKFFNEMNTLTKLKKLSWDNYNYSSLEVFKTLKNITDLNISCFGQARTMDLFDNSTMPHLQSLKIGVSSDIILTIPSNFKLSSTISTINLERTNLATLEYLNYFMEHHPNIDIDLGHHLKNYSKQFLQDPNVPCTFNFEYMKLTKVPELVKNFPNITSFKIEGKIELSSFDYINPEHIVEFHADCYLQEIPTIVSKMKNLKSLRLGSFYGGTNSIQQVPSWIGNLEYLEEIALAGNNVTRIAEEIANCKSLKNVYLHYDDGDRVHSNPICKNNYEIKKLQSLLPNTNIVFD